VTVTLADGRLSRLIGKVGAGRAQFVQVHGAVARVGKNAGKVAVGDRDRHARDADPIITRVGARRRVGDRDRMVALGDVVVGRRDGDALRHVPVGRGKGQRGLIRLQLAAGVDRDHDIGGRLRVQHHGIRIGLAGRVRAVEGRSRLVL